MPRPNVDAQRTHAPQREAPCRILIAATHASATQCAMVITDRTGSLRLSYQATTSEGSAERVDERVEIWSTQTSLGGQRQWFRSPGCHRQCRILYGGPRFWCRLCHGLRYECQFESLGQRANRRARKIRRRLGGSDCLMEEFPPRPRGMHWATYRRLEALTIAADERWEAVVMTLVGRSRGRKRLASAPPFLVPSVASVRRSAEQGGS